MGLRSRFKNMIKKAIKKDDLPKQTYTAPTPPPPPPPSEPVVAPTQPEPIENIEPKKATEDHSVTEEPVASSIEEPKEEIQETASTEEVLEANTDTVPEQQTAQPEQQTETAQTEQQTETAQTEQQGMDTEGAVAVFEIERLFPKTCPSCGDSTFNNWEYGESAFVCKSCQAEL